MRQAEKQEKPQIGMYPVIRLLTSNCVTPTNPQAPHRLKDLANEIADLFCKPFKRKNYDNI